MSPKAKAESADEETARAMRIEDARKNLRAMIENEIMANVPSHNRAGFLMLLSEVSASMYADDNVRTGISTWPRGLAVYAVALHLFGRGRVQAVMVLSAWFGAVGLFSGLSSVVHTFRLLTS
jgi:hypothetical protein